jgi:hypothetical protein
MPGKKPTVTIDRGLKGKVDEPGIRRVDSTMRWEIFAVRTRIRHNQVLAHEALLSVLPDRRLADLEAPDTMFADAAGCVDGHQASPVGCAERWTECCSPSFLGL